jgi:UDP-N-acetylmuramoylalanine--D-glutamate ligase
MPVLQFQLDDGNVSAHIGDGERDARSSDRHHTMEKYAEAKARLFVNQRAADFAVLNANDPICASFAGRGRGTPVWFSSTREVSPGAFLRNGCIILEGAPLMTAAEVPLRGLHNLENTMAAAAIARLAGVAHAQIREGGVMTFGRRTSPRVCARAG